MARPSRRNLVLFGSSGLLGREIHASLRLHGLEVHAPRRTQVSLTNRIQLREFLESRRPQVLINAAGFTDVDKSEAEPQMALAVNTRAVEEMLEYSRKFHTRFIHISTASVFTGTPGQRFDIYSSMNPTNTYNQTKAAAETLCYQGLREGIDLAWIRTYWLYGQGKGTFVDYAVDRLRDGKSLEVVEDQWGQPTWSRDLAALVNAVVDQPDAQGPIHGVNSGRASRIDWVRSVASRLNLDSSLIKPISAADFSAVAPRPEACILLTSQDSSLGLPLRPWEVALDEYLRVTYQ